MGRCFDIVAHSIIDIGWPLRSVLDKPIVASSTCYSLEQEEKEWLHAKNFLRAELLRSAISGPLSSATSDYSPALIL